MSQLRIKQIAKRANFYAETKKLPAEAIQKAHAHYANDVTFLLGEIDRLKANETQFLEICADMNETIETLRAKKQALENKLRQTVEKYDLNKEIFSPPNNDVISGPNHQRITDNRTPST